MPKLDPVKLYKLLASKSVADRAADALIASPVVGIPYFRGKKKGSNTMMRKYGPLSARLEKIAPKERNVENLVKQSSENTSSLFSEFRKEREKTAAGLVSLTQLVPAIIAGTAISDGISSLGSSAGKIGTPTADVFGYKLYKSLFPGTSGMVGMTRAPEEAFKATATSFGKELGKSTATGIKDFVSDILQKNHKVIYSTPRRKMIFSQLRKEDQTIKAMPLKQALEAYHSMVEVAPSLSTDKNAVKSFLRTVAVSPEGGVDWNTMKGLADAEISVNKARGINS